MSTFYEKIRKEVLDNFDSLIKHQSVIKNHDNKTEKKKNYMEEKEKEKYKNLLLLIEDKLDEIQNKKTGSKTIRNNTARYADVREYEHTKKFLENTKTEVQKLIEDINKKMDNSTGGSHHRKTKRNTTKRRNTKKRRY